MNIIRGSARESTASRRQLKSWLIQGNNQFVCSHSEAFFNLRATAAETTAFIDSANSKLAATHHRLRLYAALAHAWLGVRADSPPTPSSSEAARNTTFAFHFPTLHTPTTTRLSSFGAFEFTMSGGGSRKRIKMSHQTGSDSSGVKALCDANPAKDTVCRHESTLQTLNTDIDAIRQLITCKICTRLLTEPYSLACGHTYCYICISGWFNVHRMTCPDCRIKITQQPAPSYILKEMTHIFASRVELLPDGETTKELDEQIKEAADTVTKAKNNKNAATGGLFKGLFKNGRRGMPLMPIYDPSDGVDRCPNCNWELEGESLSAHHMDALSL